MKGMFILKGFLGILLLVFCIAPLHQASAVSDPNDYQGCKDPALFSRMPGFYIYNCQELDFDSLDFPVSPHKNQRVEGHYYNINYYAKEGIRIPSGLQVTRNYVNAAKSIGGMKVYEFEDGGTQYATMRIVKNNIEVWAMVHGASNGMYTVRIIEKQMMNQAVAANAESLAGNINETGKASVYGIYFDTGKSEIKPESEPALSEIAKLLRANSSIKLYIVGHTDNVGAFDYNIKLSQSRAAAVVNELVNKKGIAVSRLIPFGAGATAPVTSNMNEEGRAKNRRVELVAQ